MKTESEDTKKRLRSLVRERKKLVRAEELHRASLRVAEALEALPHFAGADTVVLYWPLPDEVDLRPVAERWLGRKRILLPVMRGDTLVLKPFTGASGLSVADFGIMEPASGEEEVPQAGIIVVPGMGFDPGGRRLGRGKGFYDRLLAGVSLYKVGVCFGFQLFDEVPSRAHDVAMDAVVCGWPDRSEVYGPEGK